MTKTQIDDRYIEGKYHGFNNEGVALVYLRMESHPSDFVPLSPRTPTTVSPTENKWFTFAKLIMSSRSDGFVTEKERRKFLTKWGQIQGDDFTAQVLESIMTEGESEND